MINEILINPPVATYNNQVKLDDLRRINYVFGANGTGKTTISRVIDSAQGHEHCALRWQGANELQSLVYNRDFVDRNFNQGGPLQGVFTLGENQVEAERKIAELQPEKEKIIEKIQRLNIQLNGPDGESGKRRELEDLKPALQRKCWRQKQAHDSYFKEAFSGVRNSAERFTERVLFEKASNTATLLPLTELKDKAQTVFSGTLERAELLNSISADRLILFEQNPLLEKVIVGNQDIDIAALIESLGNSDWVKQGRQYYEQSPDTCPFCQQPVDKSFGDTLAAFFSKTYDTSIEALKQLKREYDSASNQLLNTLQSNASLNNSFLKDELFNAEAQALSERLKSNLSKIENKIQEPSRKVELDPVELFTTKLQDLIDSANNCAFEHNQTVENIATEKAGLVSQVWQFVISELDDELTQYQQSTDRLEATIVGMESSLGENQERLRAMNKEIKTLERQTTSIQPTISAINDLLTRFGFNSFSIGEAGDGTHYQIIRSNGDDAAHSLSEGEKTFITFLYFYQLVKGAQEPSGTTANRIVVFDDPISSLDSDILYIVSSLIKGVMEEARQPHSQIKQIFILTHNVYFHKEISFNGSGL